MSWFLYFSVYHWGDIVKKCSKNGVFWEKMKGGIVCRRGVEPLVHFESEQQGTRNPTQT